MPSPTTALSGPAVRVAEITAEHDLLAPPELPLHLAGPPGTVAVQLRRTVRRVSMGAGLARNEELVSRVRALPGLPPVVTSPAGGTFIVGGEAWLGLCAVGVPPAGQVMPLDWFLGLLIPWFDAALAEFGVAVTMGRVEGAWCPGFSDLACDGRKLAGLGFRVTREWVVMRGVMPVAPISAEDHAVLAACHALIDVEVRDSASVSLSECTDDPQASSVAGILERWRDVTA